MKMKIKASLALLSAITCTSSVFAQESSDVVVRSKSERVVYEDTSEFHRLNKSANINVQLLGIGPGFTSATMVSGGLFINPKSLILLEAGTGKNSFGSGSLNSKYELKTVNFGAHYKRFVGNTFYIKGGAEYTNVKADYSYESKFLTSTSKVRRELEGNLTTASFAIGNQWQWENFTLGCDWFGISAPIASSTTKKNVETTFSDNYDNEAIDADEKTLFKDVSFQAVKFYIGASF